MLPEQELVVACLKLVELHEAEIYVFLKLTKAQHLQSVLRNNSYLMQFIGTTDRLRRFS
jgi:hypothetical protein